MLQVSLKKQMYRWRDPFALKLLENLTPRIGRGADARDPFVAADNELSADVAARFGSHLVLEQDAREPGGRKPPHRPLHVHRVPVPAEMHRAVQCAAPTANRCRALDLPHAVHQPPSFTLCSVQSCAAVRGVLNRAAVMVSKHGDSPGVGVAYDGQRSSRLDDVAPLVQDLPVRQQARVRRAQAGGGDAEATHEGDRQPCRSFAGTCEAGCRHVQPERTSVLHCMTGVCSMRAFVSQAYQGNAHHSVVAVEWRSSQSASRSPASSMSLADSPS